MYELKIAVLELTRRCNLSCLHCGTNCSASPMDQNKELTSGQWVKILKDIADMGAKKVVFSGGEPTLKDGLESLIKSCKDLGLEYGLVTNGYSISGKIWQAMKEIPPYSIGFSLDGLWQTHNQIRRNDMSWIKVISSIDQAMKLGIYTAAITTVHKKNCYDLVGLANFIAFAGINAWQIQLATPLGRMKEYGQYFDVENDKSIFIKICREITEWREIYLDVNIQAADCFGWAPPGLIRKGDYEGCSAGIHSLGIDAYGNVLPCLSMQIGISCGNLIQKNLRTIWRDSEAFDFNRKFRKEDAGSLCRQCQLVKNCRGGCGVQSYSYYKQFSNSPFCYGRDLNLI